MFTAASLIPAKTWKQSECPSTDDWIAKHSISTVEYYSVIKSSEGLIHATRASSLKSCPTLRPHRLQPTRLLCPWDSPGKSTGEGCHALLQGIFPTQGSNPGLLHCRWAPHHLSHQGTAEESIPKPQKRRGRTTKADNKIEVTSAST